MARRWIVGVILMGAMAVLAWQRLPKPDRSAAAAQRVKPDLVKALAAKKLNWGAPVFIRIFKEEKQLELWADDGKQFRLFKTWAICKFSGALGPKLKEGDGQAPEGFYFVPRARMNPHSRFHLSFNLGYPNAYDRARANAPAAR